jgi:hypothetical protein
MNIFFFKIFIKYEMGCVYVAYCIVYFTYWCISKGGDVHLHMKRGCVHSYYAYQPSALASAGGTDRDLAAPQFPRIFGAITFISLYSFISKRFNIL